MNALPERYLRNDAAGIWWAAVRAVDSARLVGEAVRATDDSLEICGHKIDLAELGRIVVVGAGKAGAGMAAGFERAVGRERLESRVSGWVNVPADCVRPLAKIHLHDARPAGVNEPTDAGVEGSQRIVELVSSLEPRDVCVVLISGGGSALLPAPVPEITLADKQAVTRLLMHSGATIDELNCVRKQLSQIKGGKLARAATSGLVITLIISDVVGDPLDVIASGPTVTDRSTAEDALRVLEQRISHPSAVPPLVIEYLKQKAAQSEKPSAITANVYNHVIGNNATALEAARREAVRRGYAVHSFGSDVRGEAQQVGRELAVACVAVRDEHVPVSPPACLLSGGEPVVHFESGLQGGKGGRNQELVLAAAEYFQKRSMDRIVLLSGGTDGEDGPTDAAGAVLDAEVLESADENHLLPTDFLLRHDSYYFFEACGGLLQTGPTHTNVMDLRVAVIGGAETPDTARPARPE